jgi:two-component sensor histidine kinase
MKLKLVAVAFVALAPVVAMLAYNEVAMRQTRNDEVRSQAAQAARQASSEVERIIEGLRSLLVAVSSMGPVRDLDAEGCSKALSAVAENVENVRTIFVIDASGVPVCGSAQAPKGTTFADRDYFKAAVETRDFAVGTYTKSRMSDTAVLPVAMPVIEGNRLKAVVVSGIRLDWLQNRITERGVAPGNAVTIADGNGTILARVPLPERFVGTVIPQAYRPLVHAEQPGVLEALSQDGTSRVLGYRPVALPFSPLYVSAGFSTEQAFAPINRSTLTNALAIAGGAILSLVAAVMIGNRSLLMPISRIAEVMQRWRDGDVGARTAMTGSDELSAVGASLDALLDELDCRRRRNEQAQEERTILMRELAHRVKNGFTLVSAIARQTFRGVDPSRYQAFSERLAALASTYDLLLSKEAASSSVRDILSSAARAHAGADLDSIRLLGPDIVLPPELALPLSLVVHELATNATKYGCLGVETGVVSVIWRLDGERLDFTWVETGGPPVDPPSQKGFGSVLIERAFPAQAKARSIFDFRPEGLVFEMSFLVPGTERSRAALTTSTSVHEDIA